jgi:Fe-S-cluster containining protein
MRGMLNRFRFSCTGCGKCCTGRGEYYVEVTADEQRRIQRALDVSWVWFRRRYLTVYEDGTESLRWAGNRCVFLGRDHRCRIYEARPAQCRHYPFWPEVVKNAGAWRREQRRCEGIGRGAVIPLAQVRRRLAAQRRARRS